MENFKLLRKNYTMEKDVQNVQILIENLGKLKLLNSLLKKLERFMVINMIIVK